MSKRVADKHLNQTTMSALLYAKFQVVAPELKRLGQEIQKRAVLSAGAEVGAEAEYESLMNELYQSYSATRGRLIMPIVTKQIKDISAAPSSSKDLIAFARSSVSYIHGICLDEIDLWREWFDHDGGVYDFLESICEPLYDHIRPRIIRETQLLKLCELCTLLQSRYMEDEEDDVEPPPLNQLNFARLIHPALQDAQTRLVFLTLSMLRNDIENYKPKPEDIDFPAGNRRGVATGVATQQPVLSGRKDTVNGNPAMISKSPVVGDEDGVSDGVDMTSGLNTALANLNWYPTLRKAIWLLSNIYRLVNVCVYTIIRSVDSDTTAVNCFRRSSAPDSPPNDRISPQRCVTNIHQSITCRWSALPHRAPFNPQTANRCLRHRVRHFRRISRLFHRYKYLLGAS